jgi:membrane associated rhomboid family serine protease
MIPIADSVPTRRTPYVNVALIGLCVLVFLQELAAGPRLDALVHRFGVTPRLLSAALAGDPRVPESVWLTLLTSQFLHAGWAHLLGNMLFLWIFGDNVEDRLGHFLYLVFYLACGAGAALLQALTAPLSPLPLIGASGAIAGVLGAFFILYPWAWVTVLIPAFLFLLPIDVPAVLMLLLWFVSQLFNGLAAITYVSATGGIAFWAHVGGFLIGLVLALLLPKAPRVPRVPAATSAAGAVPAGVLFIVRIVTTLLDLLGLLLLARFVVVLIAPAGRGLMAWLAELVLVASWPFVEPFAGVAPLIRFGSWQVEVYTLVALLAYHLLGAALAWLLMAAARPRRAVSVR